MPSDYPKKYVFYCPVNGWDCPYWKDDGTCQMYDEGDNPIEECDDAYFFYGDDKLDDCVVECG